MTGLWEKQLKEIEKGNFNAGTFINNMKKMVDQLVYEVRSESTRANISSATIVNSKATKKKVTKNSDTDISKIDCPKCKKGKILKGSFAFGCSAYKNGCNFKAPFTFLDKKISEKQLIRLITKGATVNLKGFKREHGTAEGIIKFNEYFEYVLEEKKKAITPDILTCPKCKKGTVLKGKTAYGCSNYATGCDFKFLFERIKQQAGNKPLTKELVYHILNGNK